jgi:hypothetical protein
VSEELTRETVFVLESGHVPRASDNWQWLAQLLDCWKKKYFCVKYDWLNCQNKKLGYMLCHQIGPSEVEQKMGINMSTEWTNNKVIYYGGIRWWQLLPLRKKNYQWDITLV